MKAAFLERPGKLLIKDVETPVPGDDEVLVHIKATGICGSDLHYYREGRVGTNVITGPHILGHECAGEIAETGKNVTGLKVGDAVTVEPGIPCLQCDLCLQGRYNLCNSVRFLGAPPNHGTFREYIAHKALFVHKLAPGVSFAEGAFVEPLAVGYNAIAKAGLKMGDSILIIGAGPIGIVSMLFALIAGAGEVVITDFDKYRLKIAESLGGTVLDVSKAAPESNHFDCVIEAAGDPSAYPVIIDGVKKGGRLVIVGMSNNPIPVNFTALLRKEAVIYTIYRYVNFYQPVLRLFENGKIDVNGLISHTFTLDRIEEAFKTADDPKIDKMKIIVS